MSTHIVESLDSIPTFTDSAVTVGSYDGVHRGHRAMLDHLRSIATERGLASIAITFDPHHRLFFGREKKPFLLTDRDEKIDLLERTGVDHVLVLPFGRPLAGMLAEAFVRDVLRHTIGCRTLLVGHDQAIGRDQIAGRDAIARVAEPAGVEVVTIDPVAEGGTAVSSTRARRLVREGSVAAAAELLGYPVFMTGQVVRGVARGRRLGYPTANLALAEPFKLVPAEGIYAAEADLPGRRERVAGMLYIGNRPTFGEDSRAIELFVLDYEGDLYGAKLRVYALERLRRDMAFGSAEELVAQIRLDERGARAYFHAREGSRPGIMLDDAGAGR